LRARPGQGWNVSQVPLLTSSLRSACRFAFALWLALPFALPITQAAPAGELNISGGPDDPPTLDPALAADARSLFVVRQLFAGLVRLDDDLNVVPDLAASLPDVSPDGLVYSFTLR